MSAPVITSVDFELDTTLGEELAWLPGGRATARATFDDGSRKAVFSFYTDELRFRESSLVGLTEREAHRLFHATDVGYLQSIS